VIKVINKILTEVKLTGDTVGPVGVMARFMYSVLHDQGSAEEAAKGALNVKIMSGGTSVEVAGGNGDSPYAQERDVTPKELADLRAEVQELDILSESLGRNGDDE
jgi:hypothetical protein